MKVRKAVIPVAGFGTRFLPATKATPKEMFPLVDKPLAQYVVEEAAAAGIEEVIFVTGQAKRAIEDHFDRNFELEYLLQRKEKNAELSQIKDISEIVQFAYIRQKEMKGLGHAILQARRLVGDEPFAVMTPDDIFSGNGAALKDLVDAYDETQSPIIGVTKVPNDLTHLYGIVSGEEVRAGLLRVSNVVEKPQPDQSPTNYAVAGRYILFPEVFDILESLPPGVGNEVQLADANNELARLRSVYAAEISGTYHDAGSRMGYLQAIVEFALAREDIGADFRAFVTERLTKD